jgi:hypothetical protein
MNKTIPAIRLSLKWCWAVPLLTLVAFETTPVAAQLATPGSGNYLVVPTTTKLQRYYFKDFENVNAFVFINAMDPISEDGRKLDAAAVDVDSMRRALAGYGGIDPPGSTIIAIRTRSKPQIAHAAGMLSRAVARYGREAGLRECEIDFRRYRETNEYFNNWQGLVSAFAKPPTKQEIVAEAGKGDEQAMVFAAHTPLSRMLYGGEFDVPSDCVFFIIPPIGDADIDRIVETTRRAVSKMKFVTRKRILLSFHSKDWQSDETKSAVREVTEHPWHETLGFESYAWGLWQPPPMKTLEAHRLAQKTQDSATTSGTIDRASLPKLQRLALAMHQYHGTHKRFPAHASYKDGKAVLSWRVHLLPVLGEQALYQQFKMNEPWDSPHNKKLIAKMPKAFAGSSDELNQAGKTRYLAPVGAENIFTGKPEGVVMSDVTDRNTLMFVEATVARAVVWTKPADLKVDPKKPATGLFEEGTDRFNAVFSDGIARPVPKLHPAPLRAMFTRNAADF